MHVVLSSDARLSDDAGGEELVVPSQEVPQVPFLYSMEDFPLERSRDDTLRFAQDQVKQN